MRATKIDFFDHLFTCPLCRVEILFTSIHTTIVMSRRACPSRKGEVLIHENKIEAVNDKKPPKAEHRAKSRVQKSYIS